MIPGIPTRLLDRWTKQAIAEEQAEMLGPREAAAARIKAANARAAKECPAATAAADAALRKAIELEKAAVAATVEFRRLRGASMGIAAATQSQVGLAEAFLIHSADPTIEEAISELQWHWQDTRRNDKLETIEQPTETHFGAASARSPVANNTGSIARRLRALESAIRDLRALQLAPDQTEVAAQIAAIRATIPPIEPAQIPKETIATRARKLVGAESYEQRLQRSRGF